MKYLRVVFFVLAMTGISLALVALVDVDGESWHRFAVLMRWMKWLIIPTLIVLVPKIIQKATKKTLTQEQRKILLQCQIIMAFVFVMMEFYSRARGS